MQTTALHLIRHPFRLLVSGSSGKGKTTLIKKIVLNYFTKQVDEIIIISPTANSQFREPGFDEAEKIDNVEEGIGKITSMIEIRKRGDDSLKTRTLVIIDDAAGDKATNNRRKGDFAQLSVMTNHFNISVFGLFQQAKTCDANFRDNVNGVIMFATTRLEDMDILYKEYNPSIYLKKMVFFSLMDELWGPKQTNFCFIHKPARNRICYFRNFEEIVDFTCLQ